ncbi:MAG: lysophospholipid acyltransferase family protein [Acidimicrobiales bacterium]
MSGPSEEASSPASSPNEAPSPNGRAAVVERAALSGSNRAATAAVGSQPSRRQVLWYKFARAVLFGLSWLVWRMSFYGQEHLPQTTPYVIAPVHRSYLDTFFAAFVVRRRVRFMGKEEMWAKPWASRLLSSLGAFPVRLQGQSGTDLRRGTPDREALRNCLRALSAGEPVVMFPEGTRRSGPVVEPLLGGTAFVALRANVPIVPVGIGGSERAMPRGSKLLRPGRIAVVVGKPLWPPVRPHGAPVLRQDVDEMTAKLRVDLQRVFDEARRLAGEP